MKTTLGEIKKFNPCKEGWEKLCKTLGTTELDTEVSILQIIESNGVDDAFWALRTQDYKDYCLILADIAESLIDIFESLQHEDDRPRMAIKAIRDYEAGKISRIELNHFRLSASDAARSAANIAADYAAGVATNAANIAANIAATRIAAYTAHAAADFFNINRPIFDDEYRRDRSIRISYAAIAIKIQRQVNENILRKHLGD